VLPLPFVPKGATYQDEDEKVRLESRNGVIQAAYVLHRVAEWSPTDRITPELCLKLQELAITQIFRCAGYFRDGPVTISDVAHQPPDHTEVKGLVEEMCAYLYDNWASPAIHLASYVMWRMNWIHPFYGGNGRTARALSYLVLSVRLHFVLPGTKTIPELIVENREPYYQALRSADRAWQQGVVEVTAMEDLMGSLLAKQLVAIHKQATGRDVPGVGAIDEA